MVRDFSALLSVICIHGDLEAPTTLRTSIYTHTQLNIRLFKTYTFKNKCYDFLKLIMIGVIFVESIQSSTSLLAQFRYILDKDIRMKPRIRKKLMGKFLDIFKNSKCWMLVSRSKYYILSFSKIYFYLIFIICYVCVPLYWYVHMTSGALRIKRGHILWSRNFRSL